MHRKRDLIVLFFMFLYLAAAIITVLLFTAPKPRLVKTLGVQTISVNDSPDLPKITRVYSLTNVSRTTASAPKVHLDATLTTLAQARADDMARRQYFAHKDPDGKHFYDYLADTQFIRLFACENVAMDSSIEADTYIEHWLSSTKGHRECLLHPEVALAGFGIAKLEIESNKTHDIDTYIVVAILAAAPTTK